MLTGLEILGTLAKDGWDGAGRQQKSNNNNNGRPGMENAVA